MATQLIKPAQQPFPEEPDNGSDTDLFTESIGTRPTLQHVSDIVPNEDLDQVASRLANFHELALVHVSIKVGRHHPSHYHREGPHTIFVTEGEGMMRVGDVEFPISRGSFVIVPPGVPHYSKNTGNVPLNYVMTITPHRR